MMDEDGQLSEFARQLLLRHHRVASAPAASFVPDTLTSSNTGSRIADGSLTTVAGAAEYTTADNGTTISGKLFTGNVTITGDCTNIIFEDCKFTGDIDGGIFFNFIAHGANSGVIVRYCTFAPSAAASAGTTCLDISGVTVHRCHITGFENAIRAYGDDVTITQNLIEVPNENDPSSHIDGIEGYGRPGVGISNLTIQENRIDLGTADATSPCYLSPYVSISGAVVDSNLLIGGSYNGYNESGVSDLQVIGNHMKGSAFGYWTATGGTTTTQILYWEDNFDADDLTETGRIYIPGLGIERPVP